MCHDQDYTPSLIGGEVTTKRGHSPEAIVDRPPERIQAYGTRSEQIRKGAVEEGKPEDNLDIVLYQEDHQSPVTTNRVALSDLLCPVLVKKNDIDLVYVFSVLRSALWGTEGGRGSGLAEQADGEFREALSALSAGGRKAGEHRVGPVAALGAVAG